MPNPRTTSLKPELDLKSLRDLKRRLKGAESATIDLGHLKPKWMKERAMYLHELAAIHHFGVRDKATGVFRTPKRPYLAKGLQRISEDNKFWSDLGNIVITGKLNGTNFQLNALLRKYGIKAREALKDAIRNDYLGLRRNKPSTMVRKGSTVPMVDTQELVNNISFRISRGHKGSRRTRGITNI